MKFSSAFNFSFRKQFLSDFTINWVSLYAVPKTLSSTLLLLIQCREWFQNTVYRIFWSRVINSSSEHSPLKIAPTSNRLLLCLATWEWRIMWHWINWSRTARRGRMTSSGIWGILVGCQGTSSFPGENWSPFAAIALLFYLITYLNRSSMTLTIIHSDLLRSERLQCYCVLVRNNTYFNWTQFFTSYLLPDNFS